MKRRRWIGAASVIALTLILITVRSLDAPLFLYPSSASLPAGLYMRSFEPVRTGTIAAFSAPKAAQRYQETAVAQMPSDHLFLKPIAAGPGDLVCNSLEKGLEVNNVWIAPVAKADSYGRLLPIWRLCRQLHQDEFFTFSNFAPNSPDSRYYGPVQVDNLPATYRRISLCVWLCQS